jgi:hypothetical protein
VLLYACERLAAGKMDESIRTHPVHEPKIKKKKQHRGKKHKKYRSSSTVSIQQSTPAREAQQRKLSMYSGEVNESSRVNELPNTPLAGKEHTHQGVPNGGSGVKVALHPALLSQITPNSLRIATVQEHKQDMLSNIKLALPMGESIDEKDKAINTRAALYLQTFNEKHSACDPDEEAKNYFEEIQQTGETGDIHIDFAINLISEEYKETIKNILNKKGAFDKFSEPTKDAKKLMTKCQIKYVTIVLDETNKTLLWNGVKLGSHYPTGSSLFKGTPSECWSATIITPRLTLVLFHRVPFRCRPPKLR